jgi:membrane protein implicated in regulation of membrane protease activity
MLGPILCCTAGLLWFFLVMLPWAPLSALAVALLSPLWLALGLLFKLSHLVWLAATKQRLLTKRLEKRSLELIDRLLAAEDRLYK